jgi:hypothetical protein
VVDYTKLTQKKWQITLNVGSVVIRWNEIQLDHVQNKYTLGIRIDWIQFCIKSRYDSHRMYRKI